LSPAQLGFRIFSGDPKTGLIEKLVDTGDLDPATAEKPGRRILDATEMPFFSDKLWIELWTTDLFHAMSPRRWTGWIGGGGVGLTGLVVALLFAQIRARERQALLLSELGEAYGSLKRAQRERVRLSRDLHDGAIQSLYAVGLQIQHAVRHIQSDPVRSVGSLDDSNRLVQDTIVELREFLHTLQEERVAEKSFADSVEDLFERLRRTTSVEYELAASKEALHLPSEVVMELVKVVREAVSNALRHGKPKSITVTLRREGERLRLVVLDDGCGFDPEERRDRGHGLGNMRDRAKDLGGKLAVESSKGEGTRIEIDFPIPTENRFGQRSTE
jgi:signal transduction histidine kinase